MAAVSSADLSLPITVAGVKFRNPFFIASGPVSKSVEQLVAAEETGWGGSSIKLTFDPTPYINREPRYGWWGDRLTFTAEKRMSLREGLALMRDGRKQTKRIVLMANCTYAGDRGAAGWVRIAQKFEDAGAHIIELNMCCPNMSFNLEVTGGSANTPHTGASLGQNLNAVSEIVAAVKKAIGIPLFVKLTPEGGRIAQVAKACLDAGADAVGGTANRLGIPPVDVRNPTASSYSLQKEISMSCHCGKWLQPLALRDVYQMRNLIGPKGALTGAGGIETWEDAVRIAMVGADLFGVCTGVIVNGFGIIGDIMAGVQAYLREMHYKSLADVRDVLIGKVASAASLTLYDGHAQMGERKYAPCKVACPNTVPAQSYVRLVADGKLREAYDMIVTSGPFQSVCGRVCPAFCEEQCVRGEVDDPIAIRELKRYVLDHARAQGWRPDIRKGKATGKKVAVIGSGRPGLSAAYYLAIAGHKVTVYEKDDLPGGMIRYGIPHFRMPSELLDEEVRFITDLGVRIQCGKRLGDGLSFETLRKDYDAVLLAVGAPIGSDIRVPGRDAPGCISAIEFLRQASLGMPIKPGRRTAVIGGGYTAMDAARMAKRLGADEGFVLYRRTKDEMPASAEEVEAAEKEGVKIMYLVSPKEFVLAEGRVAKSAMVNLVLGERDLSGRRQPVEVRGTDFSLALDMVIIATGQTVDRASLPPSLAITSAGTIAVKGESLVTAARGVFAAGDAVTGPATVIEAVNQGKRAAAEMDAFLQGRKAVLQPVRDLEEMDRTSVLERDRVIRRRKRAMPVVLGVGRQKASPGTRALAFDEDERPWTYSAEEARDEADRCLRCGCGVGCGICSQICNQFAITREGDGFAIDLDKCVACGMCFQRCPTGTISMQQGKKVYRGATGGAGH